MSEELKRAVEQIDRWANYEWTTADQIAVKSELSTFTAGDLRLLLSERAELLATVERLETALIEKADEGMLVLETLAALSPNNAHRHVKEGLAMARKARAAALTTGEEK